MHLHACSTAKRTHAAVWGGDDSRGEEEKERKKKKEEDVSALSFKDNNFNLLYWQLLTSLYI